ncbi:phosphonate ABC transporter ATP-binding protein [Natrarchaeobaculum sulfurireducens]|uniref:ABC-type phosphate/phosphonate transport system,ATPase component n=1 Tax=Natrarchaeobaculum sulfurireducens TaxID=2044521 RepID=A0A346PV90_9EURY|nr:phosphonate ABC transporter ATP-binding protein [Natrarchaeobaculum sulfurireducens]AXR79693.1 ABC-type phosphate/phosphonate transport system,ATPase component [Natrarchaeobaculum sulfurireducens]AXR83435.1 Phosphonate ABC transporter ATP-binding protein [Natrarchaeobaculum sulfurireducens]
MGYIVAENVTKRYGDIHALKDVSFEIDEGEFVVILGQSGAGKSTLLRILNGLTTPTSGSVSIGGDTVSGRRNDVGMVFQQHYVIDQLSAYDNALTGALNRTSFLKSLFRMYDSADKREALRALETVGLLEEASQRVDHMSGGQQQRVGIARALVQKPQLLLADEPVASLDPGSAESVMGYIKTAAAERNLTTMASLHQVNLSRQFGERFLGMRDGELVFDGYIDDLTTDVIDEIYGDIETEAIRTGAKA